jgi:hypothetical protein
VKTLLTALLALTILTPAASAATVKTIWNFAVADQDGARVTAAPACLRETNVTGACATDREGVTAEDPTV